MITKTGRVRCSNEVATGDNIDITPPTDTDGDGVSNYEDDDNSGGGCFINIALPCLPDFSYFFKMLLF